MSTSLADIFCSRLVRREPRSSDPWTEGPELEAQLQALYQRGRRTWPGVNLAPEKFAAHLADIFSRDDKAALGLEDLHTDDLYLARACMEGEPRAIALCDQRYSDQIDQALARQGVDPATADDVKQTLREWLFVADAPSSSELPDSDRRGPHSGDRLCPGARRARSERA
jgi:RNA polymerase sigma-70 factor (ECF subfamily)